MYKSKGFEVLAFPCNQFGGQEPASEEEIKEFTAGFGVTFPLFGKVEVNGDNAHPLFAWLKWEKAGTLGDNIKWNFGKFLVNKNGEAIKRYSPPTNPLSITKDIEAALAEDYTPGTPTIAQE
mmetsp:Transcript_5779/g.6643  ORF Transcript_5779/g.6643 Transcript_5779/m.6643 type:complete len:122 (-) Transcript_5779:707-1072(-)